MPRTRLLPGKAPVARVVLLAAGFVALVVLVCAGCASPAAALAPRATAQASTRGPSPTTTPLPTQLASPPCAEMTPGPGSLATFPVPPDTVSTGPNGAAGAGFWIECTPGMTASSIEGYLASALPKAGWQPWNPQTQNANGCGTQANNYWQWYKDGSAVGYTVVQSALPQWRLAFCALAYGH